jgi:hypothetical protein
MFGISDKIIAAGGKPSKVLSEVFKETNSNDEYCNMESSDIHQDRSVMLWRTASGVLFGVLMLFIYTFWRRPAAGIPPVYLYPWIKYAFLGVLCSTIVSFFVMWKKESDIYKKNVQNENNAKAKIGRLFRIIIGLIGLLLLFTTIVLSLSRGFQGWFIVLFIGGYSIAFLWIAIKGRTPD